MLEVAIAVAIILVVAAVAGASNTGAGSRSGFREGPGATAPPADAAWQVRAVPVVTRLIGDLGSLGSDASAGAGAGTAGIGGRMTADAAALEGDLGSARSIGLPTSDAVRSAWSAALARIGSVIATSETTAAAAGSPQFGSQVQALQSAIAGAGDVLLQLAGQLQRSA